VIQKDQHHLLNTDGFQDQEKRKEAAAFAVQLDAKEKQVTQLVEAKEALRAQIERLEKDFQQALGAKASNDGLEYTVLKKQADKFNQEIVQQVSVAEGEINEEVQLCREANAKMVAKYKSKKDKCGQCVDQRSAKLEEFRDWQAKLASLADRESVLSGALAGLGVGQGDNAELVLRFVGAIERVRAQGDHIEKQISNFQRRIGEEAADLDVIGAKVVKTAKLDDVLKLLQEAQITCDPFEETLDKVDAQLRQIEKEVEAFLVKTRSS